MFIKRAKARPSLRAREVEDEPLPSSPLSKSIQAGDNADSPIALEEDEEGGSVMSSKKKNKIKKKDTRLSFGGDDEALDSTPFKPRKSLLSQQIKLPSTPSSSTSTPSSSTPSIYSKDYLSRLKASTPTRLVLSDPNEEETSEGLSSLARSKYRTHLVEDTTAGIPDAAAIASAKSKRQGALEAQKLGSGGGGEDYISLGGGQIAVYDGSDGPHPESRLMREEDEGGEGDEDLADYTEANERLHLGRNANKQAARRLKGEIGELIDDREADEDDEEVMEWELAQVRRATQWEEEIKPEAPISKGYKPTPIPTARPMPAIPPAQARLSKSLADLSLVKTDNERSLEQTARELASLEEQEQELRKEVERVEGKREWSEEFRRWVEMLGNFLEEKFPKLEDIEADSLHHLKQRSELTTKRREEDDSDDLALFLGVRAPLDTEIKDEFGRSPTLPPPHSAIRRSRREARQNRRIRRRQATRKTEEEDGFSTDSTLYPDDLEEYNTATTELEHRVHWLLADVKADEFRDPDRGLAVRFGDWRKKYEEEYGNAFGGLAMVQAWEFWARGEMVGWEPLRGSTSIDSFKWFNFLYRYSRPDPLASNKEDDEDDDMDIEEETPLGIDGDLVSQMVSTAVVPLLTKSFEAGSYDPYSTPQTRRAIDLADLIADLTGKDSRKFTTLLKSVLGVYHNHLLALAGEVNRVLEGGGIPPPAFDPASREGMQRYVSRRIKLLKNISVWRRQAGREVGELVTRLVGEVLRPVLGRCWGGGGREMAQKVLVVAGAVLPPDLVGFLQNGPARGY